MAELNIIWTRTADLQLIEVLEYWVKRNKSNTYSIKLLKLVMERTNQIAKTPFIYKLTDFKDIRVASLGNYSIYYQVSDANLIIYSFWDNRQNPQKLLEILQNKK